MQKSIEMARMAAEDTRRNAEAEANAILSKAKLDASHLARQIDDEHMKRHREMLAVKQEIEQYKTRIRTHCEGMIKMLDNLE